AACSLWALEQRRPDVTPPAPRVRPQPPAAADREAIAAPPARVPPDAQELIDRLGDDDEKVRDEAAKKLEALGEDVVPALRGAAKEHKDVDVRLRAGVLAAAMEKKLYGEVRKFVGHGEGMIAFALSPNKKKMVSGCWAGSKPDHAARIWDVQTGKELSQLK